MTKTGLAIVAGIKRQRREQELKEKQQAKKDKEATKEKKPE
jgi:hypothetical protein